MLNAVKKILKINKNVKKKELGPPKEIFPVSKFFSQPNSI
jgi:hypothetical protein